MKRGLKRQIKQDDLVTGVGRVLLFLRGHANEAKITAGIVIVIGSGAAGLSYFQQRRTREAEAAFASALETFHVPVAEESAGTERPPSRLYPTAAEKHRKALAEFEGVERRYGSLTAGRRARYYAALCRLELGEFAEAEKTLGGIAARREGDGLEPSLARLALAEVYRRSGQGDKAVAAYRQMVDDASFSLPRDHVLMRLSGALEEAQHLPEARASYQRLAEEFPGSVYASEARRRAEYLRAASQG